MSRVLGSAAIAGFLAIVFFAVVTAAFPDSLKITERLFCADWQEMEIETPRNYDRTFSIIPKCVGDGEEILSELRVFGAMFLIYFVPLFLVTLLGAMMSGSSKEPGYTVKTAPGVTVFVRQTEESHNLHYDDLSYSLKEKVDMVKEAYRDGKITQDELERISRQLGEVDFSEWTRGATSSVDDDIAGSLTEQLRQLQKTYEQGLITREEYDRKREKILNRF